MSKKFKFLICVLIFAIIPLIVFYKYANIEINNNNLHVINTNHADIVYVKCRIKNAGILSNSDSEYGISSLLGWLLFEKVGNLSRGKTEEYFANLGISDLYIDTSGEDFVFSFIANKVNLHDVIRFISKTFAGEQITEANLDAAKEHYPYILDVNVSRVSELLYERLMNNLFADHNYGRNRTGDDISISAVTVDSINNFLRRFFVKDNVELLFAGDISDSDAVIYARQLLDHFENSKTLLIKKEFSAKRSEEFISVINKQDMKDIVGISIGFRLDNFCDVDACACSVIMNFLFNSRYGKFIKLLQEKGIACNMDYGIEKHNYSTVCYLNAYLSKDDVKCFLDCFTNKFMNSSLQPKHMQDALLAYINYNKVGDKSIIDIDKKIKMKHNARKITDQVLLNVIRVMLDKNNCRIVVIGDNISLDQ